MILYFLLLVQVFLVASDTENGEWGFTVQWVFKESCSEREATIYVKKPVCREFCDPFYCLTVVINPFREVTVGSLNKKMIAVLYNVKLCIEETRVQAIQKDCYNATLFQYTIDWWYVYGGDPYPFRGHKWSKPNGTCTETCRSAGMACSQDLPYGDVLDAIAARSCKISRLLTYNRGSHQPGYMASTQPRCEGNLATITADRTVTARARCDANKEGFVRLCWCSTDEHVFDYGSSYFGYVQRPFTPHPIQPTTWCVKYAPASPTATYPIFSFKELVDVEPRRFSLFANWTTLRLEVQNSTQSDPLVAEWSVPYPYQINYETKKNMRYICLRYLSQSGRVDAWYKQPGSFIVRLPALNLPAGTPLQQGIVSLGRSYVRGPADVQRFNGFFVNALFTYQIGNSTAQVLWAYNCNLPGYYESSGYAPWTWIVRASILTWSDFSPSNSDVIAHELQIRDRFMTPSMVAFEDVCGKCMASATIGMEMDLYDSMTMMRNLSDQEKAQLCARVRTLVLLDEDEVYCWNVNSLGARSIINQKNRGIVLGLLDKVRMLGRKTAGVGCTNLTVSVAPYTSSWYTTSYQTVSSATTWPFPNNLRDPTCGSNVVDRCWFYDKEGVINVWHYWDQLFYDLPMGEPVDDIYYDDCKKLLFKLICFSSVNQTSCTKNDLDPVKYYLDLLKKDPLMEHCRASDVNWWYHRTGILTEEEGLQVCSSWNMAECRYQHIVGKRIPQYTLATVQDAVAGEVFIWGHSLEEADCQRRRDYLKCIDRLNCTQENTDRYNSTQFYTQKIAKEIQQYHYEFFSKAFSSYASGTWCPGLHHDIEHITPACSKCYTLMKYVNSTQPTYWASYNYVIPSNDQYVRFTMDPPNVSYHYLTWPPTTESRAGVRSGVMVDLVVVILVFVV